MHKDRTEQVNNTGSNLSKNAHVITRDDLPLSCPLPSASQWNAHPRVFLSLNEEGRATCPYCSTSYVLHQEN